MYKRHTHVACQLLSTVQVGPTTKTTQVSHTHKINKTINECNIVPVHMSSTEQNSESFHQK